MRAARAVAAALTVHLLGGCAPSVAPPTPRSGAAHAAPTPPALPDTGPARLFEGWLAAFNEGDPVKLASFVALHCSERERGGDPPDEAARGLLRFREDAGGGFDVARVESSTPTALKLVLRDRGGMSFTGFTVNVSPAAPDVIEWTDVEPTLSTEGLMTRVPLDALAKDLDRELTARAAAGSFDGVVMIAKGGAPLFARAYGLADHEARRPVTLDTKFRIGSMNKMFTSVAIATLVADGKLAFTDTLAKVLPDYPNAEVARKITVHQLLTHTSGLGDIFGPEFDAKKDSLRTLRDYLTLFADKPLEHEPGARFRYSNAGFIVLGLVVERLSGASYYDYVKARVLDPAGMKDTASTPRTERDPRIAVGYTRRGAAPGAPPRPNDDTLPFRGMSAGGGESTAGDLARFASALASGKLLPPALATTITTAKVEAEGGRYAYGFFVGTSAGRRVVGHDGGAPGMNGELAIYWTEGLSVVVLASADPPRASAVATYVKDRLIVN